jgi:hypothetical protein
VAVPLPVIPANWPVAVCTTHVPLMTLGFPKGSRLPLTNEWPRPQIVPASFSVGVLPSCSVNVVVAA